MLSSMGWIAYKFQLWPGVRYGIGTMTNDLEEAEEVLDKTDHRMLNVLGIATHSQEGMATHSLNLWWIWTLQFCYQATDKKIKPVAST